VRLTTLLLLCALLAGACAAPSRLKEDKAAVEARLQRYTELMQALDAGGVAAMFAPDGEMVNPRQPPVKGRAAIEKFIAGFSGFRVISISQVASSTLIDGDTAEQMGDYRQKVRTPDGRLLDISGRFEIEWVRSATDGWLLLQVATFPSA
jgi:uncharacterized protein (TIGR02246 family)